MITADYYYSDLIEGTLLIFSNDGVEKLQACLGTEPAILYIGSHSEVPVTSMPS